MNETMKIYILTWIQFLNEMLDRWVFREKPNKTQYRHIHYRNELAKFWWDEFTDKGRVFASHASDPGSSPESIDKEKSQGM